MTATIRAEGTSVFPRFLDVGYPNIERGEGVWLFTTDGRKILDACSGGAMVSCLGYGVADVINAAASQANQIAYYYNHHFTNRPQEQLAERLVTLVAPEMARVKFTSGGSEANETAIRLARAYHVERGQPQRWRVISPAQRTAAFTAAAVREISLGLRPRLAGDAQVRSHRRSGIG